MSEEKIFEWIFSQFSAAHFSSWQVIFLACLYLFRKWFIRPVRLYFRNKVKVHLGVLKDILEHYFSVQEKRVGASWAVNDTLKSLDDSLKVIVQRLFQGDTKSFKGGS